MRMADYVPPTVTVDGVLFQLVDGALCVLLIKRKKEPFKGSWALPGGYSARNETTIQALDRVFKTKTGIDLGSLGLLEQLYTFDTAAALDPRGHAVSVTYLGLCKDLSPSSSHTTETPAFFSIDTLPGLAYEHADIISYAYERLRGKITYTNVVFALLPALFTFTQLQTAYEAILGRILDKRNFRKKFLSLGLIEETAEYLKEGAHRPARLYRFKRQQLQVLSRSFD
jgi:8-oxo-dGTP diphosphatase